MKTPEERHTDLYYKILGILKENFYPLGEVDDDAQCAEMLAKLFEQQCQKQLREELIKFAQSGMTYPSYTENGARIIVDEYLKKKGLPL